MASHEAACQHLSVLIRRYESTDAERVREIHAQAFRRTDAPEAVPPEVALFDALVEADDVIPQLSLVPYVMVILLATSSAVGQRSKLAPSLHWAQSQSIPGISWRARGWR